MPQTERFLPMVQVKFEISQCSVSNFYAMKTPTVSLGNNPANNVPLSYDEKTWHYHFGTIQLISVFIRSESLLSHSKNQSNIMKVQSKKYEGSYRGKPFLLLLFKKANLVATERCFKIGVPKKYLWKSSCFSKVADLKPAALLTINSPICIFFKVLCFYTLKIQEQLF